jgi:hypothetical protein
MAIWQVVSSDFELASMEGALEAIQKGALPERTSGTLLGRVEAADPLEAFERAQKKLGPQIGILVDVLERHGYSEIHNIGCVIQIRDKKRRMLQVRLPAPTRHYFYDLGTQIPEVGMLHPLPLD